MTRGEGVSNGACGSPMTSAADCQRNTNVVENKSKTVLWTMICIKNGVCRKSKNVCSVNPKKLPGEGGSNAVWMGVKGRVVKGRMTCIMTCRLVTSTYLPCLPAYCNTN